jgi:hypothetical protein
MVLRSIVLLLLLAGVELGAQSVVASYRRDFSESGAPAPGWRYLWNAPAAWAVGNTGDQASGFIGAPDAYRALTLAAGIYTPDGDTDGNNNAPAGFLRLSATGGQAGPHAGAVNKRARYAIAAFTVPQSGLYAIASSFISVPNAGSDGVEVLVFPGKSEAVLRTVALPTSTANFDIEIGHLESGQSIYVAFGPGATAAFDNFLMDFDIVRTDRLSLRDQLVNGIAARQNPITLLPGRYFANPSGAYIRVENFNPASTVSIIADGVELVMQSGNRALGFIRSSNFLLQGLLVDFDPQLYRQGTVESINNNTFRVRLHEGFPQTLTSAATSGIIYEPSTLRMRQLTDTFYPTAVNQVEPGLFTVTTAFRLANLQVNDYVSMTEPVSIPHTLYLEDCSNIRFENVEVNGAPAFALLSRDGHDLTMDNVRVIPGPTPLRASVPRLLSSNADGLHFKSSTGPIHIQNCQFAYNGDDSIILTAAYAPIIAKSQGNVITVAVKARTEKLRPGDPLYLYNVTTGAREEATIASVTPSSLSAAEIQAQVAALFPLARITNSTFELARIVTLTAPINTAIGGLAANRNSDNSGSTITNNSISNTRARGILVKASNVIVRNNVIFNTILPGIQLLPEADLWLEGDFARNVTIENNELRRCALGLNSSYAPIYVSARGFDNWTSGAGHSNLLIARNQIFNAPGASIILEYADDVELRSNRFITSHNIRGTNPWYDSVIRIQRAKSVRVTGLNLAMGINQSNANLNALVATGFNVSGLQIIGGVLLDSDQDGLPDVWEQQYFGNTTVAKPGDDPNGNGLTLAQEFIAGLNPLSADAFSAYISASANGASVHWAPRPNRFVTILASSSPTSGFSALARDIPADLGIFPLPAALPPNHSFIRLQITD